MDKLTIYTIIEVLVVLMLVFIFYNERRHGRWSSDAIDKLRNLLREDFFKNINDEAWELSRDNTGKAKDHGEDRSAAKQLEHKEAKIKRLQQEVDNLRRYRKLFFAIEDTSPLIAETEQKNPAAIQCLNLDTPAATATGNQSHEEIRLAKKVSRWRQRVDILEQREKVYGQILQQLKAQQKILRQKKHTRSVSSRQIQDRNYRFLKKQIEHKQTQLEDTKHELLSVEAEYESLVNQYQTFMDEKANSLTESANEKTKQGLYQQQANTISHSVIDNGLAKPHDIENGDFDYRRQYEKVSSIRNRNTFLEEQVKLLLERGECFERIEQEYQILKEGYLQLASNFRQLENKTIPDAEKLQQLAHIENTYPRLQNDYADAEKHVQHSAQQR